MSRKLQFCIISRLCINLFKKKKNGLVRNIFFNSSKHYTIIVLYKLINNINCYRLIRDKNSFLFDNLFINIIVFNVFCVEFTLDHLIIF